MKLEKVLVLIQSSIIYQTSSATLIIISNHTHPLNNELKIIPPTQNKKHEANKTNEQTKVREKPRIIQKLEEVTTPSNISK